MPESECRDCRKMFHAETNEGLCKQEIEHHRSSKNETGSVHLCHHFVIFDDKGDISFMRVYAHGAFENVINDI